MKKKKLLVYLGLDMYYRNYLTYNSLELEGYEIVYYGDRRTQQKLLYTLQPEKFRGLISFPPGKLKARIYNWLNSVLIFRNVKKSKSFTYHLNRMSGRARFLFRILSLPGIFEASVRLMHAILGGSPEIDKILQKENPDLVIAPSTTDVPIHYYLIKGCKARNLKCLLLIDGWDNISSKTVFPIKPHQIAVWGHQSREQAVRIHGFKEQQVSLIGTPRFDGYLLESKKSPPTPSPYPFRYALFTGCNLPFDEITALKYLDWIIEKNELKDLKIVYRPHPWMQKRQSFNVFLETDYKHVVLDNQMREYYALTTSRPEYKEYIFPKLDYYPPLLNHAQFTISSLTTMIMEAALVNKAVLVLAYDDGVHANNPAVQLRGYEHFDGIENIPAFKFCFQLKDLEKKFLDLVRETNRECEKDYAKGVDHILRRSSERYSSRLQGIVDRMANDQSSSPSITSPDA